MWNYVPTKRHLQTVLLFSFNLEKSAAKCHWLLTETHGDYTLSIKTCEYWFKRFKNCDCDTKDKERPGHTKKIEDEELETLLHKDACQTQDEVAELMGVYRLIVSRRLHALWMIQKQENWVSYELKPRDVDFAACQRSAQCWKTHENLLGNA